MNPDVTLSAGMATLWRRRQRLLFVAGAVLAALSVLGLVLDSNRFFAAYLVGFLFCLGLSLGCLALQMLHFLTGGRWGIAVERILEASARNLPFIAVMFAPVLFGMGNLYPWAHSDLVAKVPILQHRSGYLNPILFSVRAAIYFMIWTGTSWLLHRSAALSHDIAEYRRTRSVAAAGLILYVFTLTFASIDWAESLRPEFASTMWGFLFVAQQGMSAVALTIGTAVLLTANVGYAAVFTRDRLHDLGKMMLMFVMLWSYFQFSEFLIIWSGNLPREINFYRTRIATSWGWIPVLLFFLQFAIPFLLLLSRTVKRTPSIMSALVVLVLVMRVVDLYWKILPDRNSQGLSINWIDVVVPAFLFSVWLALYIGQVLKRELLPTGDPRLEQVLSHGH